jgi:Uri superfamily endonuclease
MEPGIYILLLYGEGRIRIGSLGIITFTPGFYGYVGSALGPGGLARVLRHIRTASSVGKKPRWHIDYLLMDPGFRLFRVYCAMTSEKLECPLAQALHLPTIHGFGSSDCCCEGHLFFSSDDPDVAFTASFQVLGLHPVRKELSLLGSRRDDQPIGNV